MDSLNLGITTYTILSASIIIALTVTGIIIRNRYTQSVDNNNINVIPIEANHQENIEEVDEISDDDEDYLYHTNISGQFESSRIDI